jgi:ComF family protein
MLKTISRIILPSRCVLCQGPGHADLDICQSCYQSLPFIQHACAQCALPLEGEARMDSLCGYCLNHPPVFDHSLSLLRYENKAVQLVTRYKFHNSLSYSKLLAELLLGQLINIEKADCMIAVPLHKKRLYQRGFNQSHELAKLISKRLGIPLTSRVVERVRETEKQTGLDAKQRRQNIRGAFAVMEPIQYRHVALVDDVVTTGSTVNELARVLKKAGVQTISVWSIARAI